MIAVITTSSGHPLILRSDPSVEDVRAFVAEVKRRYVAGEAGGPSGIPAELPISAAFFDSEDTFRNNLKAKGKRINLSGILEKS